MPGIDASSSQVRAGVLFATLAAIGYLTWQVLQPFVVAGLWAVVVVVTSWPGMLWLQQRLGGRRWLASTLLILGMLLLLVVPLTLAITAAVVNAGEMAERAKGLASMRLPAPPAWLVGLPFVGAKLQLFWEQVATAGFDGLLARLAPYTGTLTKRLLAEAGDFGFVLVDFLLTLAIAALLYARGESAAALAQAIGRRLGGLRGEDAVLLTTQAIRGVALGVGGTAVVQSVLAAIGLSLAGVPFIALLTAVTFVLCLAQLGTPLVMLPAVAWVFWSGDTGWGVFLLVWSLVIGTADNVVRPMLIQRGVDLPFWLAFTGVVGGLLAFGLVGLFIGPVVLAVASMLIERWLAVPVAVSVEGAATPGEAAPPEPGPELPPRG